MSTPLNYATQYSQALANAFPHVLRFGALYTTPNNETYKVIDAQTIRIPKLKTTGRVDGDRDRIGEKKRNFSNEWESKTLTNHRKWDTLIHPMDVIQTSMISTIQNVTRTFNEQEKFPEMDRYCISKIYADWVALGNTPKTEILTVDNVLYVFDSMMEAQDDARTPEMGRILYVTPTTNTLLKNAKDIMRQISLKDGNTQLTRVITRLDEVQIEKVPSDIMKTAFNFDVGSVVAPGANTIQMALIHPSAVLTPVQYQFSQVSPPAAMSDGKWVYYEESFEDVFILNERAASINFAIKE